MIMYLQAHRVDVVAQTSGCWLQSEFSRELAQCSCRVLRVGKESDSVRVERRRGPREMRPVCFRYFTRVLKMKTQKQTHHQYIHNLLKNLPCSDYLLTQMMREPSGPVRDWSQ